MTSRVHALEQGRDVGDAAPGFDGTADTAADARLLALLRRGDEAAYEQLVRAESRHLLTVARRLLRNEEDAQDAVQQAFLSAFRALPTFNGHCRLSTWLHRIVTNAALMKLRSRSRRPEESIEDLLPRFQDDGHHVEQYQEWTLPPDARIARHETRMGIRAAIAQLPDSYRTVLLLRDIEELSTEETAQVLGLNTNTVKIRLHRARQALMTLVDPVLRPQGSSRPPRPPASKQSPEPPGVTRAPVDDAEGLPRC
jgi:RNA polymerase sigma-70 factor, ECF subfamily